VVSLHAAPPEKNDFHERASMHAARYRRSSREVDCANRGNRERERSVFVCSLLPGSAAVSTVDLEVTSDLSVVPGRSAAGILIRFNLTFPADGRLDRTGRAADCRRISPLSDCSRSFPFSLISTQCGKTRNVIQVSSVRVHAR